MNQRTLAKAGVPTSSSPTAPDRVGALLAATLYRPWPIDRTASNVVAAMSKVSGVIIAITSSSITVRRNDAASTYAISPVTTFTEGPNAITHSDLTFGEHVGIHLSPSRTPTAANINIQEAVLTGKVMTVDDNKITIDNRKGVSGMIVVNALTTFAKSGVATSFSELNIGSVIRARGWVDATLSHLDASRVTIERPETPALPGAGFV